LREITPIGPVAYRYSSWAFNRFIVSVRREYGRIVYFRVVEEQPRRLAPHLHLLAASVAFMPQPELVRLAVRAGLGRIVDIREVRSLKAGAGYLAKYASKTSGASVPRGYHFYTRSFMWAVLSRAARRAAWDVRRAADDATYEYVLEEDGFALVVSLGLDLSPPATARAL
jgi:hypothetical protein